MNLFSFLGSTKLKVDKMLLQEVSEEIEVDDVSIFVIYISFQF